MYKLLITNINKTYYYPEEFKTLKEAKTRKKDLEGIIRIKKEKEIIKYE